MKYLDQLLTRAKQNKLGHFYILECNSPEEQAYEILTTFVNQFIKRYYHEVEQVHYPIKLLMDHPDVIFIGNLPETKDKDTTPFKVEEASALHHFFEFKPIQAKRKFAVITEGHRITPQVANKCLKLFEEPVGEATIFLLNPRGQKLLSTIESRGVRLRLLGANSPIDEVIWNHFIQDVKTLTLHPFLEKYTKSPRPLTDWTQEYLHWEGLDVVSAPQKDAALSWVRKFQEMETFHQPTATKWTLFYAHLQEQVLPRLTR